VADDPALQHRKSAEKVKQIGGWKRYDDQWVELLEKLTEK